MDKFIYRTPIYKSIENIGSNKVVCEIGNIALMCPECFHMIETNISSTKIINNIDKPNNFTTCNEYYGFCPNCKESVRFDTIDINMMQIISVLNTKGYYTAFCCEGHIDPDDYDGIEGFRTPYIYFYFWKDSEILNTNPLPDDWHIDDEECEVFCIRGAKLITYFENDNEYFKYMKKVKNGWCERQKKALEDIYNWAIGLPDKDEGTKYMQREFIKKFGDWIINTNADKIISANNNE